MKIQFNQRISRVMIVSVIIACNIISTSKAQDVRFSQPFTNVLGLNPAMMGPNNDFKVALNHRSQWTTLNSGYKTYNLNVLYPYFLKNGHNKLDFGLGVQNRTQGAFDFLNANLSIGYQLKLNDNGHNLSASIQGAYLQNSLNTNDIVFDDQYRAGSFDPSNASAENISNETVSGADASFGLLWFYNPGPDSGKIHAYFGLSVYHLNQPDESYTNSGIGIPIRQSFQTGIKIITNGELTFSPHLMYTTHGGSEELAIGLYVDYLISEKFTGTLGGWYREDNALSIILGIRFQDFYLGYSYDILTSHLNSSIQGLTTHEVSLQYGLNLANKKSLNRGSNLLSYY